MVKPKAKIMGLALISIIFYLIKLRNNKYAEKIDTIITNKKKN